MGYDQLIQLRVRTGRCAWCDKESRDLFWLKDTKTKKKIGLCSGCVMAVHEVAQTILDHPDKEW